MELLGYQNFYHWGFEIFEVNECNVSHFIYFFGKEIATIFSHNLLLICKKMLDILRQISYILKRLFSFSYWEMMGNDFARFTKDLYKYKSYDLRGIRTRLLPTTKPLYHLSYLGLVAVK
jgi:hypothetical protein